MGLTESEELLQIYLGEVDTRSGALVEGGARLSDGTLSPDSLPELIRDAHTLKGSSYMMSRPELGKASAALERCWKHVQASGVRDSPMLGGAAQEVAAMLPKAARQPELAEEVEAAATRLLSIVDGADMSQASSPQPDLVGRELDGDESRLGGLLASIEQELAGTVTRVDSGGLYRLINRVVEIGAEAEALTDLTRVAIEGADPNKLLAAWRGQLERLSDDLAELQQWAVTLANVPFGEAVQTFPQFVRFLGRRLGKEVRLEMTGTDVQVDRQIVDLLREPLRHLIVNAVDHGIESPTARATAGKRTTGTVWLLATTNDDRLLVTVADDGRGVDWEAVRGRAEEHSLPTSPSELRSHLLRPGFSTVPRPTDFSGTGEGLALVADAADRLGGSVLVESEEGKGTIVRLDLPLSMVLQGVVIVAAGDQFFGISEPAVIGSVPLASGGARPGDRSREIVYQGEAIPVVSLAELMGIRQPGVEEQGLVVTTRSGLVAAAVTEITGRRQVAVKSLGPIIEDAGHITGAAFLGGGEVLVLVDHHRLGWHARLGPAGSEQRPRILVVDDSAGVRQLIAATLRGNGFDVALAPSARDAVQAIAQHGYDALVVDYAMPQSNGVELVRALRQAGVAIPIIMVSGVADETDKAAAWEAGVDAYLDKHDLRRGALTTSVSRLLEERARRR